MELRKQNWIKHEEFPYEMIAGLTYDSGNYEAATEKAEQMFDMAGPAGRAGRAAERKDPVQLGIGISTFTEMCGLAPSRVLGSLSYGAGGWETASVRMLPTGKVEVVSGATPHGQGHHTAWSQIVADSLGVPFEDVELVAGDTKSSPKGMDTYGSRSLVVGGVAIHKATGKVLEKAKRVAAHLLEASEDDLEFGQGTFSVKGSPEAKLTIQEVALATFAAHNLPDGMEPSLDSDYVYDPENFSYPHGTHLCAVEIDTETGFTTIRKYVCVDDVGKIVNPVIVEGQIHGGLAQGIAQALYEEAVYDAEGNLTTGSLVDYLVPARPTCRTSTPVAPRPRRPATRWASRASARPARSPRPRGDERGRRRAAAVRHHGHRHAGHPRAGLAGAAGQGHDAGDRRYGQLRRQSDRQHRRRRLLGRSSAVIPADFEYVAPTTLAEAVSALGEAGEDAKILAGGQSLIPVLRLRLAFPTTLVDLSRVAELRGVTDEATRSSSGDDQAQRRDRRPARAAARPAAGRGDLDRRRPAVRHRGTFGGRSRTPTRPATSPAVAWRSTPSSSPRGPAVAGPSRRGLLRRLPRDDPVAGRDPRGRPASRSSPGRGACATRSSTASRRPGRSSASPRPCAWRAGRSPRRASASPTWARRPCAPPASRRRSSAPRTRRPWQPPAPRSPTGSTRRPTSAARPTTGRTSPACSPPAPWRTPPG
jgi:hypothetical protein